MAGEGLPVKASSGRDVNASHIQAAGSARAKALRWGESVLSERRGGQGAQRGMSEGTVGRDDITQRAAGQVMQTRLS